jgi:hypothetical protein
VLILKGVKVVCFDTLLEGQQYTRRTQLLALVLIAATGQLFHFVAGTVGPGEKPPIHRLRIPNVTINSFIVPAPYARIFNAAEYEKMFRLGGHNFLPFSVSQTPSYGMGCHSSSTICSIAQRLIWWQWRSLISLIWDGARGQIFDDIRICFQSNDGVANPWVDRWRDSYIENTNCDGYIRDGFWHGHLREAEACNGEYPWSISALHFFQLGIDCLKLPARHGSIDSPANGDNEGKNGYNTIRILGVSQVVPPSQNNRYWIFHWASLLFGIIFVIWGIMCMQVARTNGQCVKGIVLFAFGWLIVFFSVSIWISA